MISTEFFGEVVGAVLPYLATILSALAGWAALALARWIDGKVKEERARAVLRRLNDEVWTAVLELQQTAADGLKEAQADGKLTKDHAMAIRAAALGKVKSYMGAKGLALLVRVLQPDELEEYILGRVEAAIADLKQKK